MTEVDSDMSNEDDSVLLSQKPNGTHIKHASYKKKRRKDKPNMNQTPSNTENRTRNPRAKANILSIVTFSWMIPTFVKGYKKDLEEYDLFETLPEHQSTFLGNKLEESWLKELKKDKPSMWSALSRVFMWKLLVCGLATVVIEMVLKIGQTLALGRLIYYYTPHQTDIGKNEAYMYAGIITICSLLAVLISHNYVLGLQHLGMKVRVACCSLVYRKSLRLSKTALAETTVGQLINLLSNDVSRFDYALLHIHNIWMTPIQSVVIMYLVYLHVGWTGIIGVVFMALFIPLQIYLGKRLSTLRLKVAIKTDERVRLMNEIITGIQVIKMYTWEKSFAKLVSIARRLEIKQIKAASYVKAVNLSFSLFLSSVAMFLSLLTYVLLGNSVRAEYVFVISSFYTILKHSLTVYFPNGVSQVAEANVSVKRLQKFLLLDEMETAKFPPTPPETNGHVNGLSEKPEILGGERITVKNATGKWAESLSENTLEGINLKASDAQLIGVIGSVGCGKSSLLNAILKELPLSRGSIRVNGKVSYVPQEAWLFGGTIRENILFGQPYNEERYRMVINVCAMERDIAIFSHGDQSLVGERGVTLSGGQKARINLARAIYNESDIYLLDDPLAAVDTYVGNHLFQKCITGHLKDKCTILVTNQLQFLYSVDRIILLDNGKIAADGTYQELQASGLDFTKLLETKEDDDANINKTKKARLSIDLDDNATALPYKESKRAGNIERTVYRAYFRSGGKAYICALLFMTFFVAQIAVSGSDYFLAYWTNLEQRRAESNSTLADGSAMTTTSTTIIYASVVTLSIFVVFFRSFAFFKYCMRASRKLHDRMFNKIVTAPMRFFNTNSSGRILNRFSKDMGSIDELLPYVIIDTVQIGLKVLGVTLVVATVNPYLLIVSIVILVIFYLLRTVYLSTSRDVKRLEGVTRSPVFTHMNASLQGLSTIRAFGAQQMLKNEFDNHQDQHSSAWFMVMSSSRAFGFWLDLICVVYIGSVTMSFLFTENEVYGGNVGLAITQSLMLTGLFQWGMRQWSELENQMTSVERVVEYTNIVNEDQEGEDKKWPPESWPQEGRIEFKDVSLRYSLVDQYVLKQLNFTVTPREKVGIVGRTGAGKSSLIAALFQLVKTEGQIVIDNLDITDYPLRSVRSKISIIPQEPVLFSGTLRKNLDPFEEYSDADLWNALEEVELKSAVSEKPMALNARMSEGGTNFSVGQRQLFCLARAIVRNNNILVLDEATANVDPQTDALIQKTIRQKFSSCTVLTIAHRLHTVMDSDKVLVMDAGNMVEFDHPHVLLERKGLFYGMVQETGKAMAENLSKVAEENYKAKNVGNPS